jgi:hypothetical protein
MTHSAYLFTKSENLTSLLLTVEVMSRRFGDDWLRYELGHMRCEKRFQYVVKHPVSVMIRELRVRKDNGDCQSNQVVNVRH